MKIVMSVTQLDVVEPTAEQVQTLAELPTNLTVKEVINGYTIKGAPADLFYALYVLSYKYDVELI